MINTRLKLGSDEVTASEPVELGGCAAGSVDMVVIVLSALTRIEAIVEAGTDQVNFFRISSTVFSGEGFARFRFRVPAYRFVRVYYTASGSPGGIGVVATTINGPG